LRSTHRLGIGFAQGPRRRATAGRPYQDVMQVVPARPQGRAGSLALQTGQSRKRRCWQKHADRGISLCYACGRSIRWPHLIRGHDHGCLEALFANQPLAKGLRPVAAGDGALQWASCVGNRCRAGLVARPGPFRRCERRTCLAGLLRTNAACPFCNGHARTFAGPIGIEFDELELAIEALLQASSRCEAATFQGSP